MVFIEDAGAYYNAPLEKVWMLNQAHATDGGKIHPNARNSRMEILKDSSIVVSWDENGENGKPEKIKMKIAAYYPLGAAFEILEGPLAGSKFFNYYTPEGKRTAVTVVGDFQSPTIPEKQLKKVVLKQLDRIYREDSAYLKTMK